MFPQTVDFFSYPQPIHIEFEVTRSFLFQVLYISTSINTAKKENSKEPIHLRVLLQRIKKMSRILHCGKVPNLVSLTGILPGAPEGRVGIWNVQP